MLSRRQLFGGLSLLPFAGGLASCAARATTAPPTSSGGGTASPPAYVAPAAAWNGAAKSGGVPAVFPGGNVSADPIARTTAKPAIHWVVPSDRRLTSAQDMIIGVDADAGGTPSGIKQVDFWVEGTTQTVTVPQFLTWTENGVSKTAWGYFIKLRQSDFAAHLTGSEVRIFATAVPNDTTMQNRVIGYDANARTPLDGNYPMSVFPRAAANDFTLNVPGTYATVDAAITAAKTINSGSPAEAPLINITTAGSYEITGIPLANGNYTGGKGFMSIVGTVAGVILGRGAPFTPNDSQSWSWKPGWDGIEFRNITFQQRNFTSIIFDSKPVWFNGCTFTNSIGTRDTFYWNGNIHPEFGSPIAGYYDGCTVKYQTSHGNSGTGLAVQRYVMNCSCLQLASSIVSATHYLYNNYMRDISTHVLRDASPAIKIRYTNPGGHTSATISKTSGFAAGDVILKVDGTEVHRIAVGTTAADAIYTFQGLADAINTYGTGWDAVVLNDDRGRSRGPMNVGFMNFISSPSGPAAFSNQNTFGVYYSPACTGDIHADFLQMYAGTAVRENLIMRNTITRDVFDEGGPWINSGDTGGTWDIIIKGNVALTLQDPGQPGTPTSLGYPLLQHWVFENNTTSFEIIRADGVMTGKFDTTYSSNKNNIISYMGVYGGNGAPVGTNYWPYSAGWINNFYCDASAQVGSTVGPANSDGRSSGNVVYLYKDFAALFVDLANGDMRPAVGGTLLANLKAKANTYDGSGVAYSASDVVGARSQNATAPSYPF